MALSVSHKWHFEVPYLQAGKILPGDPGLALVVGRSLQRQPGHRLHLLELALTEVGAPAPLPEICFAPRSAPAAADWALSYAHSGGWLLAAATASGRRRLLGVDIERCRPRNYQRIDRFLGWSRESQDLEHFYRRWTLAEALLKALGGAHAKATFDALDCALESRCRKADERVAVVGRWRFRVMWPALASDVTVCWLLAEAIAT